MTHHDSFAMRTVLLSVLLVGACDDTLPSCVDLGLTPDASTCTAAGVCTIGEQSCSRSPPTTLAAREQLCGPAPIEPVLGPAISTDSRGEDWIILSPHDWDADARYMDASKAWADCMVYAKPIASGGE